MKMSDQTYALASLSAEESRHSLRMAL